MTTNQALLRGDGTKQCPYYIQGFRNEEFTNIIEGFAIARREGITRLNVAYSGRYYELRKDGWYHTSDSETCDKFHGLPPEGVLIHALR